MRPELARAVIESGWQLNELHGMGLSLEEIFLELTASKDYARTARNLSRRGTAARAAAARRQNEYSHHCRKELNTYFRSPIAYGVLGFFALMTGYFFYLFVYGFVRQGMVAAMMGQSFPLNHGRNGGAESVAEHERGRPVHHPHDHHAPVRRRKAHRHHRAAGHLADARFRDHPGQMAGRNDSVRGDAGL